MSTLTTAPADARRAPSLVLPYLALAAGVLCISFTAIFTKLGGMPGPVTAAWRMLVATVVLALPFAHQARRWGAKERAGLKWGVMGGLWFAINLGMLNSALLLTSAANATLLDNTAPIWVGLGALFLFKEQLRARYWLGLGLALAGAAVVTGINPAAGFRLQPGDALAFAGALFYAGYLLNTQRARRNLNSLSYAWLIAATATVALFAISLALRQPLTGYGLRAWLAVLGLGILSQAGGWLLISYALGYLPASAAVIVLLAQPVLTGLLAVPLLSEPLTLRQGIGGALALTGIYLCLRSNGGTATAGASEGVTP